MGGSLSESIIGACNKRGVDPVVFLETCLGLGFKLPTTVKVNGSNEVCGRPIRQRVVATDVIANYFTQERARQFGFYRVRRRALRWIGKKKTLRDVAKMSRKWLLMKPGIGERTIAYIETVLAAAKLALRE